MKYTHTNTHIRTLAMLLAFASVTVALATASAQNNTNQTTEQSSALSALTLQQKMVQNDAWIKYYTTQDRKLADYINSCAGWTQMYDKFAAPAIKKYGTAQEKETAGVISKDAKKIIKDDKASYDRIGKSLNIEGQAGDNLFNKPSEKTFETAKKTKDDLANVFNRESESVFKGGQTLVQYNQKTTEILDRIVGELKQDPKTQDAAAEIQRSWIRIRKGIPVNGVNFMKITQPIKTEPFVLKPANAAEPSPAAESGAIKAEKQEKAPPLKVLQSGPCRVLYYTEGPRAVDPTDVNGNGIPDRVEDALTATVASRLLYCKLLGFPDPLNSERLPKARFIDIRLQALGESNTNRGVFFSDDVPNNPSDAGSLIIRTQPKESARPFSIPHEFFHLVQYASTYGGRPWQGEGMARWIAQGVITGRDKDWDGTIPLGHWPLTSKEKSGLFKMSYDASGFLWNRLALLCDSDGEIPRGPVFEELKAMKYADGSPVLKGTKLVGWRLMRDVLLQLGKIDGDKRAWHDDDAILRAVEKAAAGYLPKQMSDKSAPVGAGMATDKAKK